MRLIDADKLDKEYWKLKNKYQMLDNTQYADAVIQGMHEMLLATDKMVPVEAKPVIHGHWKPAWEYSKGTVHACSRCGALVYNPTLFCPYCGAEMDEEETEE